LASSAGFVQVVSNVVYALMRSLNPRRSRQLKQEGEYNAILHGRQPCGQGGLNSCVLIRS